ncbi:MAG: zinc ribbon domain-containing protein [Clostridia bacterium]|nr:zinc ribbon domain-containing protein [Clostridia bacterium]MCI1958998.1 zinc ribbon domain-containing protein [Clostridia bacterium]MCI2001057.1 zinc ribbon domain-containing protein [Clostridia bacterium]MCI2015656.1 zinc ribbon domain-containing protein [Clostridia bacterium]
MFFMMGIMPIKKIIPYAYSHICSKCGEVCNIEITMIANCLNIFFIPLFIFGRHFYVKTSCCGTLYELDKNVGNDIRKGKNTVITEKDLTLISENFTPIKKCPNCGYEYDEDFEYCPKCGSKLR